MPTPKPSRLLAVFFSIWTPVIAITGGGMYLSGRQIARSVEESEQRAADAFTRGAASALQRRLVVVHRDMNYLAGFEHPSGHAAPRSERDRLGLARALADFLKARGPSYRRISYFDLQGRLLLQVAADQGVPLAAPRATVQDRDVLNSLGDLRRLREGQVAMSALMPGERAGGEASARAPAIRFGTRGAQDEGFFVVDYRAQEMLDQAAQEAGWDRPFFQLLDEHGQRLSSPQEEDAQGVLVPDRGGVAAAVESPEVWDRIVQGMAGGRTQADADVSSSVAFDPGTALKSAGLDLRTPDGMRWFSVIQVPRAVAYKAVTGIRANFARTFLLGAALLTVMSALLAYFIARRSDLMARMAESERLARTLLDATPDAIVVTDGGGQIVLVNESTTLMTGYARHELLHKPIEMLVPERFRAHHRTYRFAYAGAPSRRAMGEGRHLSARRKDGSEFPAIISLDTAGSAGESLLFVCEIRDVSSEHAATQRILRLNEDLAAQNAELSSTKERLQLAAAATGIGIWDWDITTDELIWDDNMFRNYGLKPGQFGRTYDAWRAAVHPDDQARCNEAVGRALDGEAPYDLVFRVVWSDGSLHYLKARGLVTRDEHGRPRRMVGTNHDVTEQQLLQLRLIQQSAELEKRVLERTAELEAARRHAESLAKVKSQFLANMSHEIRTPMNAILGLCHVLQGLDLSDDARDLVSKMNGAGRLLQVAIHDVLDLSKIEAGRLDIEHAPFSLREQITHVATVMGASAGGQDVELIIEPLPPKVDQVVGDGLRLGQVLNNLVGNAAKFTERGHVQLTIDEVARTQRAVTLRFSIADTGIGIPPDKLQAIFEPFTQADPTTTRRFGGTGLGLTISRQLIALMGGDLKVVSQPGQGSTFFFELTLEIVEPGDEAAPATDSLNVLVADDSDLAREAIIRTARGLGWSAREARSSQEAVALATQDGPGAAMWDVVLLDWKMPGLDGLGAARKIKGLAAGPGLPLVIMAAEQSRGELQHLPELRFADAVLSKPVTASSLKEAVRQAVARVRGTPVRASGRSSAPQRLQGLRLLVVDDSDYNCEVAQRIFGSEGAEVVVAGDGRQALDILGANPRTFDLVLMDIQMPGMDGLDATRAIRRHPTLSGLPVVALTAGAFRDQQDLAHEAGMNDFISKPFEVDAAVALIRKLTGRGRLDPAPGGALEATPSDARVLPGIDAATAANWGDPAKFRSFLHRFSTEYRGFLDRVQGLEPAGLAREVHQLRGAAAALGLTEVARWTAEVEVAVRADADPREALEALRDALTTVVESIRNF